MSAVNKMNPEWKAKWIQALRSGEYRQGTGHLLCLDGSMCCLGVLRAIARPNNPAAGHENVLDSITMKITGINSRGGKFLDHSFKDFDRRPGWGNKRIYVDSLWMLNDVALYSFEQIADVIEEKL